MKYISEKRLIEKFNEFFDSDEYNFEECANSILSECQEINPFDDPEFKEYIASEEAQAHDAGFAEGYNKGHNDAKCLNSWLTLEEFEVLAKDGFEGFCWIVYKGRVTDAYFDSSTGGKFRYYRLSSECFLRECIKAVMPFQKPVYFPHTKEILDANNRAMERLMNMSDEEIVDALETVEETELGRAVVEIEEFISEMDHDTMIRCGIVRNDNDV